jgi:hypothetical protein
MAMLTVPFHHHQRSDFDPFVTFVTTRLDPMSVEELYNHLLTHEIRIDHQTQSHGFQQPSANAASRQHSSRGRNACPDSNGYQHTSQPRYRGTGRGQYHPRSRGASNIGNSYGNQRPVCQLCGKTGHMAPKCFRRFDLAYQRDVSPSESHALSTISTNSANNSDSHPDTGATHHVTANMANLSLRNEDYHGTDNIQVGNGTGLCISHIGSSNLETENHSFSLKNILLVPDIQKNLLYVQQFAHANKVYFVFHANYFLIKDWRTGTLLHCKPLLNGLYSMRPSSRSSSPWALSGVRVSLEGWHKRLGHPAFPTVSKIISKFELPVSNKMRPSVCSDCQMAKSHSLPWTPRFNFQ